MPSRREAQALPDGRGCDAVAHVAHDLDAAPAPTPPARCTFAGSHHALEERPDLSEVVHARTDECGERAVGRGLYDPNSGAST